MEDHVYKQIELTGSSRTTIEDAIQNAIAKASKTLHNIHWFQVTDTRGYIVKAKPELDCYLPVVDFVVGD